MATSVPQAEIDDPRYVSIATASAQAKCPHRITDTYLNRLQCSTCGSRRINGGPWEYLTAPEFHTYTSGYDT